MPNTTPFKITVTLEEGVPFPEFGSEDQQEMAARIGFAVLSLIQADAGEEEWPAEEYPREATVTVAPARTDEPYHFADDEAKPMPWVVWSEAPAWYGEGSAGPILREKGTNHLYYWI